MTQPLPFRGEESAMDPKPCITYKVRPCQSISNGVRNGWLCSVKQNQFCRFKVDAHAEECFFDKVKTGTKMGLMFEVAEGGFLDIDVRIEGPDGKVVHQVRVRQPWSLSDELDLWNGRESNRGSHGSWPLCSKLEQHNSLAIYLSWLICLLVGQFSCF